MMKPWRAFSVTGRRKGYSARSQHFLLQKNERTFPDRLRENSQGFQLPGLKKMFANDRPLKKKKEIKVDH